MSVITNGLDRRKFLKTSLAGATGLIVGFYLPGRHEVFAAGEKSVVMNAFIHVSPDNIVTIVVSKSEMGQGVATSLPMLAAEELECDWRRIRFEFAPAARVYFDPAFGMQGTGGSTSIHSSWEPLRKAGATAREMLIAAAAQKWGVDASECRAENGEVVHMGSKSRATYGSLAEAAAKLQPPTDVKMKDAAEFKVIGKPMKRLDTSEKVNGRAKFGIDQRRPGMLHAVVLRCPVFGGKVASFDATKAKQVRGVKDVVQISDGIAVVADNTWDAMEGRRALDVKWDMGPTADVTTETIFENFGKSLDSKEGYSARKVGDAAAAFNSAATKIQAEYRAPYEAHACMEPMNCTADIREGEDAEIWAPTQFQTPSQAAAAKIAGVSPDKIIVHTTFLGGGFGRRGWSDFINQACETSKAMKAPVQVTWSREDDTQHDYYRPASLVRFSAGLDSGGKPVSFSAHIACDSIMRWFYGSVKNDFDDSSVEGIADTPYDIPNIAVNYNLVPGPVPQGFWRSVGASQNGFFRECFIDELAAAAKKDPYEFRRDLLQKNARNLGVLNLVAEKAGWSKPLPAGRYRGIAVVEAFNTYVAEVAEISLDKDKNVKVHRVWVAVDLGQPVNPAIIEQQVRGGVVFGLSQTLKGEITIDKGRVVQGNFDTFEVLRMNEMPHVEVYITDSHLTPPTGMGEPAVPPIAPAIYNAIFAATGKRVRKLPYRPDDLA
ncbi:MAG: molybdopterin cofactor-binding domain-containing protein [Candidatus Acidiferrales bacterium]